MPSAPIDDLIRRLIRDTAFREAFFRSPTIAVAGARMAVPSSDIAAVLCLSSAYFAEFARAVPADVTRAVEGSWRGALSARGH